MSSPSADERSRTSISSYRSGIVTPDLIGICAWRLSVEGLLVGDVTDIADVGPADVTVRA